MREKTLDLGLGQEFFDGAGSTWETGWLTPSPIPSGSLGASMPATAGLGQIKD